MATVEVTYGVPQASVYRSTGGAADVSIVADLYTEETITDVNGNRIETTYFLAPVPAVADRFRPVSQRQAHRIEVQRPTFSVQFSRIERAPPLSAARYYSGRVNSTTFLSEPRDRWLCNVDSSQESDNAHRVRYTFTLNATGWQATIVHSTSGLIPTDVTGANGIQTAQVYNRANFGALRLPAI